VNIGNDIEIPVLDLAKLIINITKSESKITHLPALAEGDMTRRQPDNTKMKSILNRDLITIEEGIRKMLVAFEK
jgi:UDP-glucose 4-epimerase